MQRAGGLEVADAMMIDDTKDRGVLKAGNGLGGLVVVSENDELTGLDGLDHAGRGNAGVGKQLGGLGRKLAQSAGLVGVAGILNLVEQLGQDDGAHDGVVIGVLVTKDKNVCHGFPPYACVYSYVSMVARGAAAAANVYRSAWLRSLHSYMRWSARIRTSSALPSHG